MEITKKETIEILRLYWRNLSREIEPRSSGNGVWKKLEQKLLKRMKEKNE